MTNTKLNDYIFDAMMKAVCEDVMDRQIAEWEGLDTSKPEFSPEFELKMKRLRKRSSVSVAKRIYRSMNKAAVFIIAFVLLSATTVLAVENLRHGVLNLLVGIEKEYTTLRLDPEKGNNIIGDNVYMSWTGGYFPAYIPDGYRITQMFNGGGIKSILFEFGKADEEVPEEMFIAYSELYEGTTTNIDTEDAYVEYITVKGYDAMYIEKRGVTKAVWSDGIRIFELISKLERHELLRVAENVILVE